MVFGTIISFIFPEEALITAMIAVVIMIILDLITRLVAQARKSGGFIRAIRLKNISSKILFQGTVDKLFILGVLQIIGSCAYMLSPIELPAKILMYLFYLLMFSRDATSIFENLIDAGYKGLEPFKNLTKKKLDSMLENAGGDATINQPDIPPVINKEEQI